MNALVVMHVASEGPGRLGVFLSERGDSVRTVRLHDEELLPDETAGIDLVITLGGPMNVYEDGKYPFLGHEVDFLRQAMAAEVPVLGICLGAQLIARAAGARVYRSPVEEVGWKDVTLTGEGKRDRLFLGLPESLPVLQWHGDTFDIPEGGRLLATAPECRHQAFRVGSAWGLQFHLEADRKMIAGWFDGMAGHGAIVARTDELEEESAKVCRRFCRNLAGLVPSGPREVASN